MLKTNRYIEIIFLILLLALSINTCYRHFTFGYTLSITHYLGFASLVGYVVYKLVVKEERLYPLFIILALASFNILSFMNGSYNVTIGYGDSGFELPSFNPVMFSLFGLYCIINRNLTRFIWGKIFNSSDEASRENYKKMVDFYYDKFNDYPNEELKIIFENYKDYPLEAQEAILQLKEHKGFGYDSIT
jgi:hypothetical protein